MYNVSVMRINVLLSAQVIMKCVEDLCTQCTVIVLVDFKYGHPYIDMRPTRGLVIPLVKKTVSFLGRFFIV